MKKTIHNPQPEPIVKVCSRALSALPGVNKTSSEPILPGEPAAPNMLTQVKDQAVDDYVDFESVQVPGPRSMQLMKENDRLQVVQIKILLNLPEAASCIG